MQKREIERTLLIAYWATALLWLPVDLALESSLPEELRAFLEQDFERAWALGDTVALALVLAGLFLLVSGSVRIWRASPVGRSRFTLGAVLSIAAVPAYGPVVVSGWAAALYELSATVGGSLLAVLWLPVARSTPPELQPPNPIE